MINIVGAGPGGCHLAYLLSKAGKDVRVFEEHREIGNPVQCTGITTQFLKELVEIDDSFVMNYVDKARIIAPNTEHVDIGLGEKNFIISRTKFDQFIAKKAQKAGAEILTNHRFAGIQNGHIIVRQGGKEKKYENTILVGADGPNSEVAKAAGLFGERKFFYGAQATMRLENENLVEFYPMVKAFAWIVPQSKEIVRIGLAAREKSNQQFNEFMEKRVGPDYRERILGYQGGPIPTYNPKLKTSKNNIYLIGDAATMVKATSCGGIIQSLIAAETLADSILHNKNYHKEWKKRIGMDLRIALLMRKMMDKFSEKDINRLVHLFTKEKTKKILETYDRDFPSKFALKLALAEPRLINFARFLI